MTVFAHNVRTLSKYIDDVVSDVRIINNDIIGFTEAQINPSDLILTLIITKIKF